LKSDFEFFDITLIFVADGLDSRHASFDTMFVFKTLQDQQFLQDLRAHVRKAQKGKFEKGYVPGGGIPYGLRAVPHENVNKRGLHGRYEVDYVEWEIVPEEAAVLLRIFKARAAGMSFAKIAKMLNADSVKPPRAPRLRSVASWSKTAIAEMLKNEKYIGIFRWNQSYQVYDRRTGKAKRRYRDESEWLVKQMPHLRIIPQDLWERVSAQHHARNRHAKQLGGRSRTPRAQSYIFSGLLRCGDCKGTMVITSSRRDPRYGCSDHRYRGTCSNSMTIPQPLLEQQLMERLANNLADELRLDEIARLFESELKQRLADEADVVRDLASRKAELNREKADLLKQKQNVMSFIRQVGTDDPDLHKEYIGLVKRMAEIDKQLATAESAPARRFSEREIRDFLAEQARHLSELLAGDPIRAKEELRKRVEELVLTPVVVGDERFYRISGDVRLFGNSEGVMQAKQGELLALHYTLPLKLEIGVRRWRKSSASSSLGNLNDGETPALGGELCGPNQEDIISKDLFNDRSSQQDQSSTSVEVIDGAFRDGKNPTALIVPPLASEAAAGNIV
jgi:hypothetical protein